ncbi:hypothetical protein KAW80_03395 [Candidatus Babeliales bacterium]|nr:hypothetical protein [Candidatus Babeliales bacterium]
MKNLKKLFLSILLIFLSSSPLICQNDEDDDDEWNLTNLTFDDKREEDLTNIDIEKTRAISQEAVAALLVSQLNKPIVDKTFSPRGSREAYYLVPARSRNLKKYKGFSFTPFYNHTSSVNFALGDAFSFDFDNVEDKENFFSYFSDNLQAQSVEDFATLLGLVKNLRIEQRQVGSLVQWGLNLGSVIFSIDSSILLLERNLKTTKADEDRIRELVEDFFGADQTDQIDLEGEFVRQRLGIGDTRLNLAVKAIDLNSFKLNLGLTGIFPTAVGALMDGHFESPKDSPLEQLQGFGDDLMRMRDLLLKPDLGNRKHWGVGIFAEAKLSVFRDTLDIWSRVRFDDYIPGKEQRLILFKKRIERSQVENNFSTLLEDFKRQYLAPTAFNCVVNPGSVFNTTIFGDYKISDRWTFGLGYDYYLKQREEIEKIISSDEESIGSNVELTDLNIGKAEDLPGSQHKFMSELTYNIKLKNSKLNLGLGGDYSFFADNMGNDWTLFGKVEWRF